MRTVAANDRSDQRLETVLTAHAVREQFQKLWPVMEQPGELAAPGPVRIAHVELSSGHRAAVVFHDGRDFVEILAPIASGVEVGLADLLVDITVTPTAVTWTHAEIDAAAIAALYDSAIHDVSDARARS